MLHKSRQPISLTAKLRGQQESVQLGSCAPSGSLGLSPWNERAFVGRTIVLWNTVYLERAVQALRNRGYPVDDALLQQLSPLGWEHINLTGDHVWHRNRGRKTDSFRPLRAFSQP
jgi:hypothetical protein